jgi:hypothetical protein
MRTWAEIVASPIADIYYECWTKIQDLYNNDAPELVQYIYRTWLMPWKCFIIHAYVDQYLYLSNQVTLQVEGAHSQLKSCLQISTGNLKTVYKKITLLLTHQHTKYNGVVKRSKSRIPHIAIDLFYGCLLNRISNCALGKLWEQRHHLVNLDSLPVSTNSFSKSMRLPCAYL